MKHSDTIAMSKKRKILKGNKRTAEGVKKIGLEEQYGVILNLGLTALESHGSPLSQLGAFS